jgi:uncharacterized protein YcnI
MRTTVRLALAGAAATAVAVLGFAGPAGAHVTINPDSAKPGGYTRVAFRVPTESDTASTTKLEVALPTDHPIANVGTMPVPGWTAVVEKAKLSTPIKTDDGEVTEAISKITWTADAAGSAIKPGQFQEFPVSLGPLPDADSLTFKAIQTYSDGSVVRWIDESAPGGAEPAHPAPVLKLTKAGATATATPGVVAVTTVANGKTSDGTARAFGIVGAVLGLLGLVLGGFALARSRRPAAPAG